MNRCINWPCQKADGHSGPCSSYADDDSAGLAHQAELENRELQEQRANERGAT